MADACCQCGRLTKTHVTLTLDGGLEERYCDHCRRTVYFDEALRRFDDAVTAEAALWELDMEGLTGDRAAESTIRPSPAASE